MGRHTFSTIVLGLLVPFALLFQPNLADESVSELSPTNFNSVEATDVDTAAEPVDRVSRSFDRISSFTTLPRTDATPASDRRNLAIDPIIRAARAADPNTNLSCNLASHAPQLGYEYRDAAADAIKSFCGANDGKVLKQGDTTTFLNELTFSAEYADDCKGSGSYTISKDVCISHLMQALDGCDTNTVMFKHGGTVTDTDNCGAFTFHPTGLDIASCYPDNQNKGYVSGPHVAVSPDMARDAINQFCDRRTGFNQTFTLDPNHMPSNTTFYQDECQVPGMAACGYYYTADGHRAPRNAKSDIFIRMSAAFSNPGGGFDCPPSIRHDVQGDRCRRQLGKLIGIEGPSYCPSQDSDKLDLGTILEIADQGCVLWNFWATEVQT